LSKIDLLVENPVVAKRQQNKLSTTLVALLYIRITMTNKELIEQFYRSFSEGNAEAMGACYHADVHFTDPAFGDLHGDEARSMWKMLMQRSTEPAKIQVKNVQANEETGSADWLANYKFGPKKRPVENHVSAEFKFVDGKIIRHKDDFNFWKWSRQATGLPGWLLGWTPIMKKKVQSTVNTALEKFMAADAAQN